MSAKIDQALDTILAARRKNATHLRRSTRRRGAPNKPAAQPVGGITKPKAAKKNEKAVKPLGNKTESKILVSNLPPDVNEGQIKEYFQSTVAPVKKVMLVYGPNGHSRGIANVVFANAASASKAVSDLNGVKVDNRPMKVEVVLDGKDAPAPTAPKNLAERVTQPKGVNASPKPATGNRASKAGATAGRGRNARRGRGGVRTGGRGKKTVEQLDAEMVDYFNVGDAPAGSAVQANGDTAMGEDDVM